MLSSKPIAAVLLLLLSVQVLAQDPTAQECLDRTIVALTATDQTCLIYSELVETSSKPGDVRTSSREFVKLLGDFKKLPLEFLLVKESGSDTDGSELVMATMLLTQEGKTRYGQFVNGGDISKMGLVPDEKENEDPQLKKYREKLRYIVNDARHALMLPLYYQRTDEVSVPLINAMFNGDLIDEKVENGTNASTTTKMLSSMDKNVVGVWQFGVTKVEILFSKAYSWLPTRLRWFMSKPDQPLQRSRIGEILDKPAYENDVVWKKVEDIWIPARVRYTMTNMTMMNPQRGKGHFWECIQLSSYRFKAVENLGPADGYFKELSSGGPFQELVSEMTEEVANFQSTNH